MVRTRLGDTFHVTDVVAAKRAAARLEADLAQRSRCFCAGWAYHTARIDDREAPQRAVWFELREKQLLLHLQQPHARLNRIRHYRKDGWPQQLPLGVRSSIHNFVAWIYPHHPQLLRNRRAIDVKCPLSVTQPHQTLRNRPVAASQALEVERIKPDCFGCTVQRAAYAILRPGMPSPEMWQFELCLPVCIARKLPIQKKELLRFLK
eukprot:SAG11_NODE_1052_length_6029_cov_4.823946_3_plen_206_part_00